MSRKTNDVYVGQMKFSPHCRTHDCRTNGIEPRVGVQDSCFISAP